MHVRPRITERFGEEAMTELGTNNFVVSVPDSLMPFVREQVEAGGSETASQYLNDFVIQALTKAEIQAKLKVALEQEKAGEGTEWRPGDLRAEMREIFDRHRRA
jgi:Arc/MetJ-type ribon-helix-helix transcriptional regulator